MGHRALFGRLVLFVQGRALAAGLESAIVEEGATVEVVHSASEALDVLRLKRPFAAILDVHLSDITSVGKHLQGAGIPFLLHAEKSHPAVVSRPWPDVPMLKQVLTPDLLTNALSVLAQSEAQSPLPFREIASNIESANRRIAAGEARVDHIKAIIARLERSGLDSGSAQDLLRVFTQSLELMRRNRELLARDPYQATNRILTALPPPDLEKVLARAEAVKLQARGSLQVFDKAVEYLFFPEQGYATVLTSGPKGQISSPGLVGCEGMTGMPVLLGAQKSPFTVVCEMEGSAIRLPAADATELFARLPSFRSVCMRYALLMSVQFSQTALANTHATVKERLARLLLMVQDRALSDHLSLTHEALAIMMGVRRAGVTVAAQELARSGMIHTERGVIVISSRDDLKKTAAGYYGFPEKEFDRLFN